MNTCNNTFRIVSEFFFVCILGLIIRLSLSPTYKINQSMKIARIDSFLCHSSLLESSLTEQILFGHSVTRNVSPLSCKLANKEKALFRVSKMATQTLKEEVVFVFSGYTVSTLQCDTLYQFYSIYSS